MTIYFIFFETFASLLQTVLPLATVYASPIIAFSFSFFGLACPFVSEIAPILFGLHPLIDGCMLIYTIKEYR